MGYSPWGHKELDTTFHFTFTFTCMENQENSQSENVSLWEMGKDWESGRRRWSGPWGLVYFRKHVKILHNQNLTIRISLKNDSVGLPWWSNG